MEPLQTGNTWGLVRSYPLRLIFYDTGEPKKSGHNPVKLPWMGDRKIDLICGMPQHTYGACY